MTVAPDPRYAHALQEWRRALVAWNTLCEPQSGPALDRLISARNAFLAAGRPGGIE